ncbi:MAG TPA: glycosyltransferase family 39 protein [Vicinamibacterales bacterium]|nr:glycosyltransferase family 39 protein [Vicinamibacterales bacterium]
MLINRLAIIGILLLGSALRLAEIGDGVPYTIGVDEPEIIERAVRMMKTADFNPHFYDYPGFTFYFHTAIASARFLTGAMAGRWISLESVWSGDFYLWSRIATAVLSILTIYLVYRSALRWGEPVALVAALAMAVHPQLTREAHFALTDTPLTFFVALTLVTALTAALEGRPRWFFISGLFAGLAAATKYPGALALLMPVVAMPLSMPLRDRAATLSATFGSAAIGFLLGAPFSLLDLPGFLNGFASLMQHYNRDASAVDAAVTYVKYIRGWFGWPGVLPPLVAWPAMALGLVGIIVAASQLVARETRSEAAVLLVCPIAYFWFISNQSLIYGRYAMPLAPALSIALALGILTTYRWIERRTPAGRIRYVTVGIFALLLLPPLAQSVSATRALRLESTQEQAAQWMLQNIRLDEPIVMEGAVARLPPRTHRVGETLRLIMKTVDQYRADGTVYLVSSSSETDKYFKAGDPSRVSGEIVAYNRIFRETQAVQVFTPSAQHPGPTIRILKIVK